MVLPDSVERIQVLCRDPSPRVRARAIRSLEKVGSDADIRGITSFLEDPDTRVSGAARSVIRSRLRLEYMPGPARSDESISARDRSPGAF